MGGPDDRAVKTLLQTYWSEPASEGRCTVCGLRERESDIDRNVLKFERFKWGASGVPT